MSFAFGWDAIASSLASQSRKLIIIVFKVGDRKDVYR